MSGVMVVKEVVQLEREGYVVGRVEKLRQGREAVIILGRLQAHNVTRCRNRYIGHAWLW